MKLTKLKDIEENDLRLEVISLIPDGFSFNIGTLTDDSLFIEIDKPTRYSNGVSFETIIITGSKVKNKWKVESDE